MPIIPQQVVIWDIKRMEKDSKSRNVLKKPHDLHADVIIESSGWHATKQDGGALHAAFHATWNGTSVAKIRAVLFPSGHLMIGDDIMQVVSSKTAEEDATQQARNVLLKEVAAHRSAAYRDQYNRVLKAELNADKKTDADYLAAKDALEEAKQSLKQAEQLLRDKIRDRMRQEGLVEPK